MSCIRITAFVTALGFTFVFSVIALSGDSTQSCTIVLSATVFEIELDWESSAGVLLTENIHFTCAPIKNKHLLYILVENLKNLDPKSKWVSFLHFLKFFLGLK